MGEWVFERAVSIKDPYLSSQLANVSSLSHQLPIAFGLYVSSAPAGICRFRLRNAQLRAEGFALGRSRSVHLNQLEYPLPGLLQLKVQFLELIFVEGQLVPASFERRRAAEPVVGVFNSVAVHHCALLALFGYTVIEARRLSEGLATDCKD